MKFTCSLWVQELSFTVQRHAVIGVRLIGDSKLLLRVNVSVNGCLSLVLALQHIGDLSRIYSAYHPMLAGISSGPCQLSTGDKRQGAPWTGRQFV